MSNDFYAHSSAVIDEGCQIGQGTKIWHFSHVSAGAKIGAHCNLGQNVFIANDAVIGNGVKIQNNVSVFGGITLEDYVFLGPSCVLTNVMNPRSEINRHALYDKTVLRRGCSIGANATVVCGTEVGRYAFVAAGAVVTRDVPDYALMVGVPAQRRSWVSRHGIPLPEPDADGIMVCPESQLRYREEAPQRVRCLDVDEDADLPEHMKQASKRYGEFRP